MAKLERNLTGDFNQVLSYLNQAVLDGSMSATLEEASNFSSGEFRCAVRVYERYSWTGSNRVALSLTLIGVGDRLRLTAITAGGSQGMLFKVNTLGEEAFLDTLAVALENL